jgi:hypothetical protein
MDEFHSQGDNCRMRAWSRLPKFDVAAVASLLIGAGLSIIAGKVFGWLMVGIGLGMIIVLHGPALLHSQPKESSERATVSKPPEPKPKPRLKQFGTRTASVYVPYGSAYFWEGRNEPTKALLAVFENEVHIAKTGYVGNVTARIRFKDDRGNEITELRVQEGRWLKASSPEVNFPANTQHELIVAINDSYQNQRVVREAQREYAEVKNTKFTHEKLYIEVSLISQGETLLTGHYVLLSNKNEFSLTQVES